MSPLTAPALPDTTGRTRGWQYLLITGYWFSALWAAFIAVTTAVMHLTTAGGFDYVEGVALGHQLMSAAGVPLYGSAPEQPPYSVPLYGPLFYLLYGLLLDPESPALLPARTLNLVLTACLGMLAVLVTRHRLAASSMAGALAVLLWLTLEPAGSFLLQNRPDTLALALGASGFVVATSRWRHALPIAVLILTAAAFTKQTAVVAPLFAAALVLLSSGRRRAACLLLLGVAATGLVVLLLLNAGTEGRYWETAVMANLNGFSPGSALMAWQKVGRQPLFWLSALIMLTSLTSKAPARDFAIYGLVSLALHGLAVAKPGANSNYFLEYSWCTALALAPLLDKLLRPPYGRKRMLLILTVLTAVVLSLVQATQTLERLRIAAERWPAYSEWLNHWQETVAAPVASMRPDAQLLQGYAPYVLDPHIIARLAEQGRFDESGLLEDLRSGRVGAVIAAADLTAAPGAFSNWSPAVRAAVAAHYVRVDSLGYLSVWIPQHLRSE